MSTSTTDLALYGTPLGDQALHALVVHRMLTTEQLHRLLSPDRTPQTTRMRLMTLRVDGLVDGLTLHAARTGRRIPSKVWFATAAGVERVLSDPDQHRSYVVRAPKTHRNLIAHTLAVNEVGLAFVAHARRKGHEFDAMGWEHEVAHSLGGGRAGNNGPGLISDAVISYGITHATGVRLHRRFLELDRGTEPDHVLFDKIRRYARYRTYGPTVGAGDPYWMARYPSFPTLSIVIGANPDRSDAQLTRRMHTICALAMKDPLLQRTGLQVQVCRLEMLLEAGAGGPVWWMPGHGHPVTFTGEPQ